MGVQIQLTFPDRPDSGIPVNSKRFTIGRDPDNELQIPEAELSRRHAIIENFDGVIQISDCGSQNGTLVNGLELTGSTTLSDGDVIVLGGACELRISIIRNGGQHDGVSAALRDALPPTPIRMRQSLHPLGNTSSFSVPLIAALAVVIIIGATAILLTISNNRGQQRSSPISINQGHNNDTVAQTDRSPLPNENLNQDKSGPSDNSSSMPIEQVESAAIQVIRRISSDDKTYSFSEKALHDVEEKVREYRSSNLSSVFSSLQRASPALSSQARQQGIEPGLLIFMSLAESDGGRVGDPALLARNLMPDLLALRATFGTNDADSSLIIVAAYRMGRGEKRSHPLLATMRRIVKNPLSQRNVWYLHDRGGLSQETYDFVIRFLALAVIAQDPTRFGIQAEPVVF